METQRAAEASAAEGGRADILRCGELALRQLLDPLLQLCSGAAQMELHGASAAGLGGVLGGRAGAPGAVLSVGERSVFLLNCLDALQHALGSQPATVTREHAAQRVAPSPL